MLKGNYLKKKKSSFIVDLMKISLAAAPMLNLLSSAAGEGASFSAAWLG